MNYTVRVVDPDEFEQWLDDQPRGDELMIEIDEDDVTSGSGEGDGGPSGPTGEGP